MRKGLYTLWPTKTPRVRMRIRKGISGPSAKVAKARFFDGKVFYHEDGRPTAVTKFRPDQYIELRNRHGSLIVRAGGD